MSNTLGTTTTTALTAYTWGFGNKLTAAQVATINNGILDDVNPKHQIVGGFDTSGSLVLPNGRGQINLRPGDVIAIDLTSGWPIVVSSYALTVGSSLWNKA